MNNYDADDWHVPAPDPNDTWYEAPPKDEDTWYSPNYEQENNGYGFKNPNIHINPSRINIGLARVCSVLKTVRDTVGLLPMRIKAGAMTIASKFEEAKVKRIGIKNALKQKYIAKPIAIAKAKVCSVKKAIKNKVKAAIAAVANVVLPDREKKAELQRKYEEEMQRYKDAKAAKEKMKQDGKLDNMLNDMYKEMDFGEEEAPSRKGSRGNISTYALIGLLLLSITISSILLAMSIIK